MIVDGRTAVSNDAQPPNTDALMVVTPSGILMEISDVQFQKAPYLISFIVDGRVASFNDLHPMNVHS